MLERMAENGEIVEEVKERRLMTLEMNGWRGSTKALEIENLAVAFDDDLLFYDLNLLVWHGERVGIIGPNGIGKSVLFRVILGQLEPLEGKVKIGPSMKIGYYAQEHQTLQRWWDKTPVDMVRDLVPRSEGDAIGHLITQYAFSYDHTRQPIRTLSGGERSRLQIAALILREPNLLLLDEPTNNLDIQSIEVLENALDDFEGAILTVSHDRYFLDRIVDRVHAFENGTLSRGHHGGYTDWDENREKMA
jgi:ATPase subunit of ABC transporter with duplicated ATPase domains